LKYKKGSRHEYFADSTAIIPQNISLRKDPKNKSEEFVKMSDNRFGVLTGFDLSKVKLKQRKRKADDFSKHKVRNISSSTKRSGIHRLDFLTIIIPFICLFFVTMLISAVNMFKTSLLSSPRPGPDYSKHMQALTPNIHIIEPSSSVAPWEDISGQDIGHTNFDYLTPEQK
jgi:hypothetical protein